MKDAVGGSLLLNLVVIFTSVVILFFAGIMAYSKAYRIKNRIIEVIEKHENYGTDVVAEINEDLNKAGYISLTTDDVREKCGTDNLNNTEYLYCVYLKSDTPTSEKIYEVVTYIHFDFPVIGDRLTFEVKGETKLLGKVYNY